MQENFDPVSVLSVHIKIITHNLCSQSTQQPQHNAKCKENVDSVITAHITLHSCSDRLDQPRHVIACRERGFPSVRTTCQIQQDHSNRTMAEELWTGWILQMQLIKNMHARTHTKTHPKNTHTQPKMEVLCTSPWQWIWDWELAWLNNPSSGF